MDVAPPIARPSRDKHEFPIKTGGADESAYKLRNGVRLLPERVKNFTVSLPFGGIFSAVKF